MKLSTKNTLLAFFLTLPALTLLGLVYFYPLLRVFWLSLYEKPVGGVAKYVGLKNFISVLRDDVFYYSLFVTAIYTLVGVACKLLLGLGLALFLNEEFKGRGIMRGIVIIPWVIPVFATALTFYWLYDQYLGPLNIILRHLFGIEVLWLGPDYALLSMIIVQIWKGAPFFAICLLAGLQAIPSELYEAAEIDGASTWQRFLHITLPGLRTVIITVCLLSGIWTFGEFTAPYMLTRGGPGYRTEFIAIKIYKETFSRYDFSYGSAISACLFPILLVPIILCIKYIRR